MHVYLSSKNSTIKTPVLKLPLLFYYIENGNGSINEFAEAHGIKIDNEIVNKFISTTNKYTTIKLIE